MALRFAEVANKPVVNTIAPLVNAVANVSGSMSGSSDMPGALFPCDMVRDKGQAKPKPKPKRKRKTYADGHAIDTRQAYMREYMRKVRASGKPNAV